MSNQFRQNKETTPKLNDQQLELALRNSLVEEKTVINIKAIFALVMSILFHIIIMGYIYINKPTSSDKLQNKTAAPIHIKIISKVNQSKTNTQLTDSNIITVNQIKPNYLTENIIKKEIEHVKIYKIEKPTSQMEIVKLLKKPIIIEDILADIENYMEPNTKTESIAFKESIMYSHKTKKQEQIRSNNQYFEFKSEGNSQLVRINGKCFTVITPGVFAIDQAKLWLPEGDCSKKN